MGQAGRPRFGHERTDLAGSGEGLALAALVRQTGGDIKLFSRVMGVAPSTMTKWISGYMKAPPRPELIRGLQYACSGRGCDPSTLSIRRLGHPGLAANEGCSLFAAHAVQRYVGKGFVPPRRGPVVSLDRLAATFEVQNRRAFTDFIFRSMKPHPPRGDEFAPFRFCFKSGDIHISFKPQGRRNRVHPEKGRDSGR